MTLYTFLKDEDKVVYGTTTGGRIFFFYSGFASAEEAKETCIELHKSFQKQAHSIISDSLAEAIVRPEFDAGKWSEIE